MSEKPTHESNLETKGGEEEKKTLVSGEGEQEENQNLQKLDRSEEELRNENRKRASSELAAGTSGERKATHHDIEKRLVAEGIFDENFVSLKEDAGETMLQEILTLYIGEGEETTRTLLNLSSCETCNLEEIQKVIHRFKGCSLNVGAAQMCSFCVEIRQLCVDQEVEKTKEGLANMNEAFSKLKGELETYLGSFPNKKVKN